MKITLKALIRLLHDIFNEDVTIVKANNRGCVWINIEGGPNMGSLVYDMKQDVAFSISNKWDVRIKAHFKQISLLKITNLLDEAYQESIENKSYSNIRL